MACSWTLWSDGVINVDFTIVTGRLLSVCDLLVGLVVKASAERATDSGSIPTFAMDLLSRSSHASEIDNPMATLPSSMLVYLRDGSAQTIVVTAALK